MLARSCCCWAAVRPLLVLVRSCWAASRLAMSMVRLGEYLRNGRQIVINRCWETHGNNSLQCFCYVFHFQQATTIQPANTTLYTLFTLFIDGRQARQAVSFLHKILHILNYYSATNFYNNLAFLTSDADDRVSQQKSEETYQSQNSEGARHRHSAAECGSDSGSSRFLKCFKHRTTEQREASVGK